VRIVVDFRCLQSPPPRGGVGVYAEHITRALLTGHQASAQSNQHDIEWILFANGLVDTRRHLPTLEAPNVRWYITHWPNKLWNATSFIIHHSPFTIPDLVFLPNLNFIPRLPTRTRLVVTVHDLSFEHFPDCFTPKQRLWHRFVRPRALLHRADAIIAVSETTKRDVVETYGIPEEKVHVVYPGIEDPNTQYPMSNVQSNPKSQTPVSNGHCDIGHWSLVIGHSPFILSFSELSPRKNLDGLVAAFKQLAAPAHLVIAGNHGSAERILRRQIARSPARDRIHLLGPVPENEKRALLARAACFVYPSLWEGFGFPPLEAMAAGVPVVASTGGALPEVLGDAALRSEGESLPLRGSPTAAVGEAQTASSPNPPPRGAAGAALLVDPLDPTAIADAIARVLTDSTLRTDLITRGRARTARYRWERAAERTLAILTNAR